MTEIEYQAGLEMIKTYSPEHPLLPTLLIGQSPINNLYMKSVLGGLDTKIPDDIKSDGVDVVVQNMHRERGQLYGQRAKMSNKLHDCKSNGDRAIVSDEIQMIQAQIIEINARIHRYTLTGEVVTPSKDNLPEEPFELFKIRENLRKNIPRIEKSLEQIFTWPDNKPGKQKKIEEKERKLQELKILKKHVERIIKEKTL